MDLEKNLNKLLDDVVENLKKTEFNEESLQKRVDEYSDENGNLSLYDMVGYLNNEAHHYTNFLLRETLLKLASEGYLLKPEKQSDHSK